MIYKVEPEIINILVLEDSETARTIYRRYLCSHDDVNYRIMEARTLAEGWQIWQRDRPDLVLVDVNLPDGSGLEFLEMIGDEYPDRNLPAIVLTARDDEATVMRAMELGAADYLIKENITAIALNISIRNQLRYTAALKREIARSQQQEAAIAEVALRIRQSLDLDEILTCAVREIREVLSVDRAVIYQFNRHNNSGKIVAESVTYPWRSCLDRELEDNCFEDKLALAYREGRIFVANDIYTSNLTPCHLQLLAEFQVRANVAVPILLPNAETAPLWGLLIVHQCSRTRNWQQTNIQLLQRLSVQLAIAIQQAELYQSLHQFNAELEQKVADRTQELRFFAHTAELVCHIGTQIRSSLDLQTILDTTVREIRAALQCDRVIIYQFRDDFTGRVVCESILEGGRSVLHSEASDPCITPEWIEPYRQGRIRVVRDIYQEAMTICHQELLLGFDIRAKLMVPIVVEERLWGLMIASHRDRPREWQSREIEMVRQLSIQLAIAIKQATIYQKAQTEIAERQKTEALVMDSERRYASLAAASPVGIFRTDPQGNCIYANDRCCQMIGLSPEACMGAGWRQGLHPEDRAEVATEWQRSIQENRPFQLEYRFQTPDGVETWVYGQIVPERDAKGQVVSYLGTITDISDRKQTEIALQESQRLMQRIADTSPSVLYLYDVAEQRNIYVNSAIANVLGITPEEIRALGAGFINYFMHPDDLPRVADHFQRLNSARDGDVLELEYRVRNAAGEWRWLFSRDTVFSRNADGQVGQIVGVAEDITDRLEAETNIKQLNQQLENRVQQRTAKLRQREEELRHLSDRLQLALKSGAIAIWDWDVVNNILIWDDRMYELYGITADEFTNVYETWVSRLHPEDRTLGQNAIQQALEGKKDYDLEFRAILPNGQIRYIKAFALVNRNSQGQPQRMVGINYDITQQKQAEETLRKSEAHLRTAQRISKLGSWEYYPKTGRVTWSEETFRIFGLDPKAQEPTLEAISLMFHPGDRLLHERAFQTAIATASPYNMELRIYRPNGSLAYITARGEPICNAAGIVTQLVGTVQDVTERKLAEKQLQQARDAAEYANRAKSEFLALMSHEIRTPMNGVLGLTYLALKTNPTPVQREYLSKIQSSAQSLLQIINDILDFSKIEAGKLELESAPFELDEILNNISNILALKAVEKGIELVFNIGENVPKYLVGDSLRLSQVLINLTGNAVKFTETGSVVVSVETIDPVPTLLEDTGDRIDNTVQLKFMVRDTGIGMNPSQIDSLFEAFTQADPSISRKYSGTGLGLAICQRLVKLMGGNIGVESQLNRGSNFYFEIQLGYVSECQVQETIATPDLREIKSLVVDDNSQVRDVLIHVLESFSFRVTAASSGLEALEILRRSPSADPFELVLIDWCMSDMDGIETSQQIKADPSLAHIPHILMVTAYHRAEIWELAQSAGIEAIVPKPVDRSRLFESILEVFGHQTGNQFKKSKPSVKPEKLSVIRGARILLVEDNEVNQQIAQELLQIVGLNVDIAPNGVVALEKVQGESYDLILMDIRMPEMDGLEATQRIRNLALMGKLETERFATVPIIAMTAHAMSADKAKSLEAGMNDHVSKPVNPEELYAVLVKWIAPLGPPTSGGAEERRGPPSAEEQRSRGAEEKKIPPAPLHPCTPAPRSVSEAEPLLPSLPGLNVNAGLSRIGGDWTVYQRILERFYSIHRESDREIQGALDRQDWAEAFYLVHTLKGSAGNIGGDALFQAAGDLESDLQQATANNSPPINPPINLDLLAAKSQALARCLQQVRTSISTIVSGKGEEGTADTETEAPGRGDSRIASTVEKEIDRPLVIPLVAEIISLLETDLVEAIARLETLKQQVTGTPFQVKLQAVEECLIEFDTDRAQTLLDEIGKSLEN